MGFKYPYIMSTKPLSKVDFPGQYRLDGIFSRQGKTPALEHIGMRIGLTDVNILTTQRLLPGI
jgi:hypothetical protein